MGENNSKTGKNTSKNDQLMYKKDICSESSNQHMSNYNIVSNLVYNSHQEKIAAKKTKYEKDVTGFRLQKQEHNRIIKDKERQPKKNVQEEVLRQGTQVPKLPTKTNTGDGMTVQTEAVKKRSDFFRNRKNIEKQLITNLANVEMAKLKIVYHKNKSCQRSADEDSNVLIVNGETSNDSTQVPVMNQQSIYGQPPPPYSPPSVAVFDHLSITNNTPDFSYLAASKMYQSEMRDKKAVERQRIVFSNRKGYKKDGQKTKNKRQIGIGS